MACEVSTDAVVAGAAGRGAELGRMRPRPKYRKPPVCRLDLARCRCIRAGDCRGVRSLRVSLADPGHVNSGEYETNQHNQTSQRHVQTAMAADWGGGGIGTGVAGAEIPPGCATGAAGAADIGAVAGIVFAAVMGVVAGITGATGRVAAGAEGGTRCEPLGLSMVGEASQK